MVGAASAQVTVTGDISYGWKGTKLNATNVVTQGFGGRTANIVFGVTEDLGGGLSVRASAGIDTALRNDTVTANGASMALSGGFGTLALNSGEETSNGIVGSAGGVNFADLAIGFQTTRGGTSNASAATSDSLVYTLPAMGAVSLGLLIGDSGDGATSGYGNGSSSAQNGVTQYIVSYKDGPVAAKVDMTDYAATGTSNRTRINASYDLGVAKISIGNSRGGVAAGSKKDQTAWGVTMPMGAVSLGVGGVTATTTAKVSATGLTATYALSKTTSVAFSTASTSGTIPTAGLKKLTEVYLKKAF
ncbi:MAG: porin [Proteobacteria bacterium]|nr:porin [Pseudomonadota bacterium]